jgi:hypothetical protein
VERTLASTAVACAGLAAYAYKGTIATLITGKGEVRGVVVVRAVCGGGVRGGVGRAPGETSRVSCGIVRTLL